MMMLILIWHINSVNTPYQVAQEITEHDEVKSEHLYSASANEIDEKKPKLKNLSQHLEYAYLHGDKSFSVIISSKLSEKEKMSLLILLNFNLSERSRKDNLHLSLWDFCLPTNAVWIMQCSCYFSKMHDGNLPRHGGRLYGSIHGRLLEKLTIAPIIISPDWNVPFELMCDASDFAVGAVLGQRIDGKFKPIYYASKTLNNAQEHYTTTEKELLAVVFSFDKFRQYLVLSKTVVYTDHSTLKYLFSKQDTKPRLIRRIVPPNWTPEKRRRFFSQVKNYFWDEPYAFKLCSDNVMKRYVAGNGIHEILAHCHSGPTRGHHNASITGRKVYESGFYWPSIFKDAKDYVMRYDACQRSGNISLRIKMPQNNI
ncbi:reverse transcriptase domain-containing protein [Tanacetum coccineum]